MGNDIFKSCQDTLEDMEREALGLHIKLYSMSLWQVVAADLGQTHPEDVKSSIAKVLSMFKERMKNRPQAALAQDIEQEFVSSVKDLELP
jgi:hypothetical protein